MDLFDALQRTGATQRGSRVRPDDYVIFEGGLNVMDPVLAVRPGQLLGCKNYEPGVRGGYSRVEGYERFDGQTSPTRGDFWTLTVDGVSGSPFTVGETLRQYPTGTTTTPNATGTIAYAESIDADSWYVVIVLTTGAFLNVTQDIRVGASAPGTLVGNSSFAELNGAPTDTLAESFRAQKTEYLRGLIDTVGGAAATGPVRGVAVFKDVIVAWRDNAAQTEGTMWKSSTSGWVQVALGIKIRFDQGVLEINEGDTITGLTSGATAVARRIVADDGTWGAGDAAGFIIVNSITGTFTASETLQVGGNNVARYLSQSNQTLPVGGKYRTRVHNFAGADDRRYLYGVNGVGNAFEWDGTTFTLIETGMVSDIPTHIGVRNDHLVLTYKGGSLQHSGFQRPLNWTPVLGADERSVGSDVTALIEEVNALFIGTRQQTFVFYGDVVENFRLDPYSVETGILQDTLGRIGQSIYLDDRGFTSLRQTSAYGNFQANSLSDKILTLVQNQIRQSLPVGAVISRRKNMYRCFFDDGAAFAISSRPGNKFSGWTTILIPDIPTCFDSAEVEVGTIFGERVFMGGDDGYVYELDVGRSFDGQNIEHFLRFAYHFVRTPDRYKRYRKATIDVDVTGPTTLLVTVDYNYGNREGQASESLSFTGGGGFWDIANWDEFQWSSPVFDQAIVKIEGSGFNIGLFFYGNANVEPAHTLFNVAYHYSMRRINRGTHLS